MTASVSTYGERDFEVVFEGRQIAVFKTRREYGRTEGLRGDCLLPATDEVKREARQYAEQFAAMLNVLPSSQPS